MRVAVHGERNRRVAGELLGMPEGNRDELVVSVAHAGDPSTFAPLAAAIEDKLKDRLGVGIRAEVVAPGVLDAWTEVGTSPKLKRFRDDR